MLSSIGNNSSFFSNQSDYNNRRRHVNDVSNINETHAKTAKERIE